MKKSTIAMLIGLAGVGVGSAVAYKALKPAIEEKRRGVPYVRKKNLPECVLRNIDELGLKVKRNNEDLIVSHNIKDSKFNATFHLNPVTEELYMAVEYDVYTETGHSHHKAESLYSDVWFEWELDDFINKATVEIPIPELTAPTEETKELNQTAQTIAQAD